MPCHTVTPDVSRSTFTGRLVNALVLGVADHADDFKRRVRYRIRSFDQVFKHNRFSRAHFVGSIRRELAKHLARLTRRSILFPR